MSYKYNRVLEFTYYRKITEIIRKLLSSCKVRNTSLTSSSCRMIVIHFCGNTFSSGTRIAIIMLTQYYLQSWQAYELFVSLENIKNNLYNTSPCFGISRQPPRKFYHIPMSHCKCCKLQIRPADIFKWFLGK